MRRIARLRPGADVSLILAVVLIDALLLASTDFSLDLRSEVPISLLALLLLAIFVVYRCLRPTPPLAAFARDALRLEVFTVAACILSYLLTGLSPWPLHDALFQRIDLRLGFDWVDYVHWIAGRPHLLLILKLAYASAIPQMITLLMLFSLRRQRTSADELFFGFALSGLAVVVIGALVPASGARLLHHPAAASQEPMVQYLALRDGSLRHLNLRYAQGLVWFPSFHTALAGLYVWVSRRTCWLFWPFLGLNLLLLASAPVFGGHYLVDLIAGLTLIAVTMALLRRYAGFESRPDSRAVSASSRSGVPTSDHGPS